MIQSLKETTIVWNPVLDNPASEVFIVSVDGTDCRVRERKHATLNQNKKMCSHKFKAAALKYEIAISIHTSNCVWIAGPFRGGKGDLAIYKGVEDEDDEQMQVEELGLPPYDCLEDKIVEGKLGIADGGYQGGKRLSLPNQSDPARLHAFKSRSRCRQESFNGRIKKFDVLTHTFCHTFLQHCTSFHAVCVIVQYQMNNGSELFEVKL